MGRLSYISLSLCFVMASVGANANENSQRLVQQGHQKIEAKQYKEAKFFCEQAMVADPKDVRGFVCVARALDKLGKNKQADRYYESILIRAPKNRKALHWAGLRDLENKRPDRARTKLNKLEKICGKCDDAKKLRFAYTKYKAIKKARKNASR